MGNAPNLTDSMATVLLEVSWATFTGGGTRVKAGTDRDKLRRLGLIRSKPPNSGIGPAISGRGDRWTTTAFGDELAWAIRRERQQEGRPVPGPNRRKEP